MTLTTTTAMQPTQNNEPVLPRSMTIEEWMTLDVERRVELVQGVPVMSPFESAGNISAAMRLFSMIDAQGLPCYPQLGIRWGTSRRATVRFPDVVVVRGRVDPDEFAVAPREVLLAVEVVSPSSTERDWLTKRDEYAAQGIPAYLVIDRRAGLLALFDQIVDGRYVDVEQTESVILRIGEHTTPLQAADLL